MRSLNHTKYLDGKSESLAGFCEMEIFPLKAVTEFIEIPSPFPVVYMHINDLCNLLKEDVINKKGV